jgi:hypothetical protein
VVASTLTGHPFGRNRSSPVYDQTHRCQFLDDQILLISYLDLND